MAAAGSSAFDFDSDTAFVDDDGGVEALAQADYPGSQIGAVAPGQYRPAGLQSDPFPHTAAVAADGVVRRGASSR